MYGYDNGGNNGNGIDLLSLLLEFYQIYLAYENISLNNEQIKMLMSEMRENQDKRLAEIKEQNEMLINRLEYAIKQINILLDNKQNE